LIDGEGGRKMKVEGIRKKQKIKGGKGDRKEERIEERGTG
jgi:hypothetical protein